MHIKLSGIVLLAGAVLLVLVSGAFVLRLFNPQNQAASFTAKTETGMPVPSYQVSKRDQIYTDRLSNSWSMVTYLEAGKGRAEVLPLEKDVLAEIRCNNSDSYKYASNMAGDLFFNGKLVTSTANWPACRSIEVRAGNAASVGKFYVMNIIK